MWDVEQMEVYRGPQSTSNGRNSIAGSIYVKTKEPTETWTGAARVGYRDQESYLDTSGVISGPLVEDTLSMRLSLQRLDAETITNDEGYADNPPDYDLNQIETHRARAKLKWTPSSDFSALLAYSSNNEKGDTGRIYYEAVNRSEHNRIFFRNIETDSDTTSLTLDYAFNDNLSLDVLMAVMNYQWGFDSYEANPAAEQQLAFDETNLSFDARLNFGVANDVVNGFIGIALFDREHDVVSFGSAAYNGDDESDSQALYGEITFALNDTLKLIAGGRFQQESQFRNFTYTDTYPPLDEDKSLFLPKIALLYEASANTTLGLSARKGYNSAGGALNFNAGEYYYFDEETVDTFEFSSRSSFADGALFLSANVFYNIYEGYQALSSSRSIVNMDEVVTYGAELELTANLTDRLEINVGTGLLQSEITDAGDGYADADGNELNSAPALTANVSANFHFTSAFSVGAGANYVGEYFGDFNNTEERVAGDYTLIRLNANYIVDHWQVQAFINNALDEEGILTEEPVSGRYPAGYVAIVAPRTIGASVIYSF